MTRTRTAALLTIPTLALATLTGCSSDDPVDLAVEVIEGYSTHRDAEAAAEYLGKYLRDGSRAEELTENGAAKAKMSAPPDSPFRGPTPAECEVIDPDAIAEPATKRHSTETDDFLLVDGIRFVCGDDDEFKGEAEVEVKTVDGKHMVDDLAYRFDRDSEKPVDPSGS